jgi:hypothetical protein
MTANKTEWMRARDQLAEEIKNLGFPEELGDAAARNLGSPKAMRRMISYLQNVKPKKAELIVDEMLAICGEIEEWKKKKEMQAANERYNEYLNDQKE